MEQDSLLEQKEDNSMAEDSQLALMEQNQGSLKEQRQGNPMGQDSLLE